MWQAHYFIYQMRMRQLIDEADRRRRWRLEDDENGRARDVSVNSRAGAYPGSDRGRRLVIRAVARIGALVGRLNPRAGATGVARDVHASEPPTVPERRAPDGTPGTEWTRRHAA